MSCLLFGYKKKGARKGVRKEVAPIITITSRVKGQTAYVAKRSLMSDCEMNFYNKLLRIYSARYIVQPQVNLASVIGKISDSRYQNELYRNIDFGVFDRSFKVLALIELNDKTHNERGRIERDMKVREICKQADIPLITFWTNYENQEGYIQKRIDEVLGK
ncbi:MAG: DUF2726 domain-containing protein [Firmicutes bacterium]|nr:DUF2726 domain-containing protein [Bacillota bacterium]